MIIGSIKRCPLCKNESYVRAEINKCPICGYKYDAWIPNKAPAGWVKMEDYEISRRGVEQMLKDGDITEKDLR